ncbi:Hypothetical predicted protein [Mytilus galloprovincialis]|uniref:Tyr recombinase domain-containing protein n=1 Tax=Mytilus galloprovincialis TaxID=29158 RepID=A0A8B6ELN5_MYTGA|nr:Hypothetical predicted protein [Mytilus galloprovincialis]
MGLRSSSAHICQRVTSSVVYMMKQSGYLLLNYLDDFAGAEKSEDANVVFDLLESVEKASSPSTVMTFLGVKFDTSELTISVTTERVEEILLLVKTWLNLLVATVKQLQSLLEDWFQPDEILETDATLRSCGGLQRLNPYLPRKALPITPLILKQIYEFMDLDDTQDKTFWSLFLLAFFMMSRKSNLVPNSEKEFDENKQLCRGDIIIENDVLIIILKWSKTIQFGQRKLRIPISSIQGSILCPVNAYKNMIKAIPAVKKDPAFCKVKKGRILPITYKEYQNKLRYLIQKTGRNSLFYSTHSFRRGGATLAFDAEVSTELIQLHGDWHSVMLIKSI